jgi:hypothetical protein
MALNLDLSWADEDELWAKDGLFLVDEAYKLLYDCQRQLQSPQIPQSSSAVEATSLSHPTSMVVNTFTPTLISLPKDRQVPSFSPRSRPPGAHHVPITSPPTSLPLVTPLVW